ncbi:zinc/manganese transport system substrate-binding protein/manganese/iron transport system substrate-binding protein [Nitrosomonas sp. Nm51]|uniref:metal ABC transporter substrate-binding protein n=1 Tax=Nitrosomonas sp. Nm51 TaxID=133720 RepID=UPI0008ACE10F|nr:metal ABC transporter substrate-binding protein [Nitrosomonas sp. Nm51]SER06024.1 zinc/manganese transport system substrate-binding protein/manganese/iron transport system substrate-binding protein [Nitrosomonas sp. Nm51]
MKKLSLADTIFIFFAALVLTSSLAHAEKTEKILRIATTVPPITNIVENIGGPLVTVSGIVPNGMDSHTFEPVPTDAKTLAHADIIFVNGMSLEVPTIKLAEKVKKPGTPIIRLANETLPEEEWQYDFSFPKEHGNPNPHLWPNIALTIRYVEIIRDRLAEHDPRHADIYAANASTYIAKLTQLDQAIFACVNTIPKNSRKLVTYHDSFAYFAPRYGMEVIAAIQPASFTEPGPRDIVHIIEQIKREKIPAIFGSEVFPSKIMEQIARESGARFVDELSDDELPEKPNHSFIGMMVNNIEIMTEALGGDSACASHVDAGNLLD